MSRLRLAFVAISAACVTFILRAYLPYTVAESPAVQHRQHLRGALVPSDADEHVAEPAEPEPAAVSSAAPSLTRPSHPAAECTVVSWNIHTASDDRTLDGIGSVLRARGASVVALVEVALGRSELSRRAASWGYPHTLLLRAERHRFNIALLSRDAPLRRSVASAGPPFFHGVLCAGISSADASAAEPSAELTICATHLTPHSRAKRLAEVRELRRIVPMTSRMLLVGDLNALSPHDAPDHAARGLASALRGSKGVWAKFADAEGVGLDYSALSALHSGDDGLVDLALGHAGERSHTVPTRRGGDSRHAAPMRLDYALGSRALLASCPRASFHVDVAAWG